MFIVPRKLRREVEEPQEEAKLQSEPIEGERCEMYLSGKTLLTIANACDRTLFDRDGTPVLASEYYQVTSEGISRVA